MERVGAVRREWAELVASAASLDVRELDDAEKAFALGAVYALGWVLGDDPAPTSHWLAAKIVAARAARESASS